MLPIDDRDPAIGERPPSPYGGCTIAGFKSDLLRTVGIDPLNVGVLWMTSTFVSALAPALLMTNLTFGNPSIHNQTPQTLPPSNIHSNNRLRPWAYYPGLLRWSRAGSHRSERSCNRCCRATISDAHLRLALFPVRMQNNQRHESPSFVT